MPAQPEVAPCRVLGLGKARRLRDVEVKLGGRRLGDEGGVVVDGDVALFKFNV